MTYSLTTDEININYFENEKIKNIFSDEIILSKINKNKITNEKVKISLAGRDRESESISYFVNYFYLLKYLPPKTNARLKFKSEKLNEKLIGKIKVFKRTKTLVFISSEIFGSEKIVATASGTWKIL